MNRAVENEGENNLFVSNDSKGKGIGKKESTTMAIGLVCVSVFLTFAEVEHIGQVHPWQTLMTSEEVPLLAAAKICLSLLASCRKQRVQS